MRISVPFRSECVRDAQIAVTAQVGDRGGAHVVGFEHRRSIVRTVEDVDDAHRKSQPVFLAELAARRGVEDHVVARERMRITVAVEFVGVRHGGEILSEAQVQPGADRFAQVLRGAVLRGVGAH